MSTAVISREELAQLQSIVDRLEQAFVSYAGESGIPWANEYRFHSVDDDGVNFEAHISNRGWTERETATIPFAWLEDPSAYRSEQEAWLAAEEERLRLEKEQQQVERARAREESEHKRLRELIERYPQLARKELSL